MVLDGIDYQPLHGNTIRGFSAEEIMAYSDKVLDHYNNPRNVGSLDKDANNVGTGIVGAPECGDEGNYRFR